MNIQYLSKLLDSFEIHEDFHFIDFYFLYTEDKHYPGLKKITLTSKRRHGNLNIHNYGLRPDNLLYKEIFYDEICKIFNQRLKYGMGQYFKNALPEGFHHPDAKSVNITVENDRETIAAMFLKMEKEFEEHSYTINSVKDFYV